MRIINTINQVRNIFVNQKFDLKQWKSYADEISSSLAALCEEDIHNYDFEKEVLPVIDRAIHDVKCLDQLEGSFQKVCLVLEKNLSELFGQNPDLDIILYLGLCNGAGWATQLDGRDTVLLGIEKIIELGWFQERDLLGLVFHEVGHIWHDTRRRRKPNLKLSDNFPNQFYEEGIAMVCEQILCNDSEFYHQDKEGWLLWCRENEAALKQEILLRIENGLNMQDFFGDWCCVRNHSDTGYFIGCRFIRDLLKDMCLDEIAEMDEERIQRAFVRYLRKEDRQC